MRLPDRVDATQDAGTAAADATQPAVGGLNGHNGSDRRAHPATVPLPQAAVRRRRFTIPAVGPVVGEAMQANAAIRMFYGFMIFFLARWLWSGWLQ